MNDTKTSLSCMDNSRGFQIKGLRGYILSIGIGGGHYCDNHDNGYGSKENTRKDTSTMEVAIMRGDSFVCLPHDVAGYVPVARLGALIEAVQAHDWEGVCFLCDQDDSDPDGKFPQKALDLTTSS